MSYRKDKKVKKNIVERLDIKIKIGQQIKRRDKDKDEI